MWYINGSSAFEKKTMLQGKKGVNSEKGERKKKKERKARLRGAGSGRRHKPRNPPACPVLNETGATVLNACAAWTHLVVLGGAGVERPAQEQLGDDAAQGPHVNRLTERQTKDDLRGPKEAERRKALAVWKCRSDFDTNSI